MAAIILAAIVCAGCKSQRLASAPRLTESMPAIQAHVLHGGSDSSAPTFLLPEANNQFIGTWGGDLRVDPTDIKLVANPVMPASYYFGESNGTVFLRTEVYGNAAWPVVASKVKMLDSSRVRFELDSKCSTCKPPCREVEITTLKLADAKTLKVEVEGYAYWKGDGFTMVTYRGTLHPVNAQQLAAIDSRVKRHHVLLTKINASKGAAR